MSIRSPIKRTVHTEPIKDLLKEKKTFTRYDESLFLKTSFHLQPKSQSESKLKGINKNTDQPESPEKFGQTILGIRWKRNISNSHRALPIIPNSISIFSDPMKMFT